MTKLRCFYKRERDDISPFLHIFSLQKHEEPKWGWNWAIKRPREWFTEGSTLNDFYPKNRVREKMHFDGRRGRDHSFCCSPFFSHAQASLPSFLPFPIECVKLPEEWCHKCSFVSLEGITHARVARTVMPFSKGRKLERSLKSRERCRYKECRTTI